MAVGDQVAYRLIGGFLVCNRDGRVILFRQCAVLVGKRAAHKGYIQQRQIGGGIVKPAAQQDEAPQPFFTLHDGGALQLIFVGADLLHHHGVASRGNAGFHGTDNVSVEGVGYTAHYQSNGVRLGFDQIPCGVVGDVVVVFDDLQHLAPAFVADVRPVIQYAGDGGNADAADARDVLYRHSTPSCCGAFRDKKNKVESVTGNVFASARPILAIFTWRVNEVF